ncbi:hypothetical protein [Taylorella equigenitalis]|uniref:Putative exported protein n=1 Tax=Taylorella equigenitalis 14/56 TaxID=1091497 RepID=I7IZG4_9BURK|nr:hypothetical protein [Taylorella equigenitalis]ASY29856.1 hypothetical protein B9Z30_00275 [Taylorella equigenitalis]KOS58904.1 hypothetical protein AM589_03070 [Taylorella equigenitalis]WDU46450.1 hypothetical protein KNO33_00275 [Taylorella equigenitalis]WDU54894.1 hypothetical protein KPZ19_00275 [Taylorella equigenitalis]CCG18363.1 putative exported protein [Taylorella equigenitalis 14/56]
MGKIFILLLLNIAMFAFGMGYFGVSPESLSFTHKSTKVEYKPLKIEILKTSNQLNENTSLKNS